MAQNRFSAGILSRKSGGSILTRSAYIHRDQYRDERTGKLTDDNSPDRADLEWEGLFAKDIDNVPEWWSESRERIFNELEKREDRSTRPNDAQLAYDFKISLPHELSADDRSQLISEWALKQADKGYVVDVAIHRPNPTENDPRNFHAHILMPMRPIDHDGWGNKFRAPGDSRSDFEKWSRENLKEWREHLSERGAHYLERAGFHEEAERFRAGHLARPERAKAAHDRGDGAEFDRLLDEPQRYMGPAASAMERNGKRTRTGDINREIEERNKLRGPTRDIRFAYALADGDHQTFIDALAEKDMMFARISAQDDRAQVIEFAGGGRDYVPQYRKGEHTIVTENGQVYRLTPSTTGENWKEIREFAKPLDQHNFLSLADTLEEQKRRSLIPKVDRNVVIAEMMRPRGPSYPVDLNGWLARIEAGLEPGMTAETAQMEVQLQFGLTAKHLKPESRTAVPDGAKHLRIRGSDGEQTWWAYNSSKDPEKFHESLKERGLHLARVTAEDASDSHTQHWAPKRDGGYYPLLEKGEYVVVSDRGTAFRLDDRTVGHTVRETKAFMSKLDAKPMPSLREVQNEVHEKRQKEIDREQDGSPGNGAPAYRGVSFGRVKRAAKGVLGAPVLVFANAFESLFARQISPEERRLAEVMEHERQVAAERAERQRSSHDRGR